MLKIKFINSTNPQRLILLSSVTLTLLIFAVGCQSFSSASENYPPQKSSVRQVSYQENSISLNSAELEQPLFIEITTSSNTRLVGKILLEDREIAPLKNNLKLDLSSLLHPGKNAFAIVGNYQPQSSSITVKLQGKNTQSTTSTGGNGKIQQKLIIDVL